MVEFDGILESFVNCVTVVLFGSILRFLHIASYVFCLLYVSLYVNLVCCILQYVQYVAFE